MTVRQPSANESCARVKIATTKRNHGPARETLAAISRHPTERKTATRRTNPARRRSARRMRRRLAGADFHAPPGAPRGTTGDREATEASGGAGGRNRLELHGERKAHAFPPAARVRNEARPKLKPRPGPKAAAVCSSALTGRQSPRASRPNREMTLRRARRSRTDGGRPREPARRALPDPAGSSSSGAPAGNVR
jgi:hypothetical protein